MATILFAWELGANLGHLIPISRVAAALAGEGHLSAYALRDLGNARALLGAEARVLQAPVWPNHRHFGAVSGGLASYADILTAIGFADPQKLAAVADAWRMLIDYVRPDLVVTDHSPGLHVALFGSDIPLVDIGTGFTMPPLDYEYFLPLRGDLAPAVPEQRLFESVRDARTLMGLRRPAGLIEVFRARHRVVFGLPELDPYRGFRREPIVAPPGGLPPAQPWPRARRLFVYAGAEMHNFDVLLQALATLDVSLEVYLRGDAGPAREFLRMRGATVHDEPTDLTEVLRDASHVLTQGGAGTIAAAYSAGRPQLVMPAHDEAKINLEMLVRAGVGQSLTVATDPADVAAEITRFMAHPSLPDNALELANRIARRVLPDGAVVAAEAIRGALA
jgi:UDP:flavonoid glycosyltransferase YjiC (YdhE family)